MAFVKFRGGTTTPATPTVTIAKGAPLTNLEVDGNLYSVNNSLETTVSNLSNLTTTVSNNFTSLTAVNATKAPIASPTFTGTVSGISSAMVGLGNANNTADAVKSVAASVTSQLVLSKDTRATNDSPNFGAGIRGDIKTNTTDGLNDGGTYHGVLTFQQYVDASGGGARQLGFTDNDNLWIRGSGGALTSYNAWKQLLDSNNFTSYAPTRTGLGASGSWNITSAASSTLVGGSGGQVHYQSSANTTAFLPNGNAGLFLQSNGGIAAPTWTTVPAGTLSGSTLASNVTASSLTSFGSNIVLGTPSSGIMTNVTGTASGLTAGNVTTNANLTGSITSVGNATTVAAAQPSITSLGTLAGLTVTAPIAGSVTGSSGSTTGNAATVTNATFSRQFTVRDDRSDGNDYSLAARATGLYAITSTGTNGPGASFLSLIHVSNGSDVAFQIAGGYTSDNMYFRGTYALQNGNGYTTWRAVLHNGNYNSYSPTLTGANASGTWGINVTGSSGSTTGNAANTSSLSNSFGNANNWTNTNTFLSSQNTSYVGPAGTLWALSTGTGAGATGACMSFHRYGNYAINMGLDDDNVFRIGGWSAAANRLQLDMSGNFTVAGNVTAYSDERLKTNWKDLPLTFIEELAKVKHGTYDRVDIVDTRQVGVSAQALQVVMPEAVMEDKQGTLSVAYGNAALTACIALAKEVVALRAEIEMLKAK